MCAHKYLCLNKNTVTNFSSENIASLYNQGYVFIRVGKGRMDQTRSLRIDLAKFELSSENRRVLRKTENIKLETSALPLALNPPPLLGEEQREGYYHWSIGKLAKDFYDTKFGNKTFSANKIKELLTEPDKSNFNFLLVYSTVIPSERSDEESLAQSPIGYCIAYQNSEILHYCYPFYNIQYQISNIGMTMMLKAICWAKKQNKKYVYLGSFQRPTDTYKLQFAGLEWFDGKEWQTDLKKLKNQLSS